MRWAIPSAGRAVMDGAGQVPVAEHEAEFGVPGRPWICLVGMDLAGG